MAKITEANIHISVRLDNSADDQCGYDESFTVFLNDELERNEVLPALIHFIGEFKREVQKTPAVVTAANRMMDEG